MKPLESEAETGLPLRSRIFSMANWATLPRAGDETDLAFQGLAPRGQHLGGEVDAAVAGGLRADEGAAPVDALAGEHAGEVVGDALVLAEEVADLPAAHPDVPGGHVGVGADVAVELGHEALAEAHDLGVGLALGVEVRSPFAAAHGQRGEGVLEHLLEGQELEDAQVDARGGSEARPCRGRWPSSSGCGSRGSPGSRPRRPSRGPGT